ncbi:MAG: ATPase [Candidatus Aegiribacteria sp. MLS_C]|nr:MAG: ATPase [Candidatus Aegiribacteria sp. MLS_C]
MLRDFRRRFWIALGLSLPVLVLSPMIQTILGYSLSFTGDTAVMLALSSFVYGYCGWPFLRGGAGELREGLPGMMTLISLALTVAFVYSSLVALGVRGKVFFWELVTLVDVMLLGHWMEMRSVMGASRALEELVELMPSGAHRLRDDGSTEDVELDRVSRGDRLLVKPGERIPADGRIVEGESEVDLSMVTGESEPVSVSESDQVIGGSVNGNGSLTVEVSGSGEDSYLSGMVEMVKKAGESKSRAQGLADRAAFWLTITAIAAGSLTLGAWLILGREFVFALERMVTVMVITCPHALGLAVPLVISVITGIAARNGLLIRNRTSFEGARSIDTVVFDKTGTLTTGEFRVVSVKPLGNSGEDEVLALAAAVDRDSEHSIARAIVKEAADRDIGVPDSSGFQAVPGKGAKAEVSGETVQVGNRKLLEETAGDHGKSEEASEELSSKGMTVVFVISGEEVKGLIGLADTVRESSRSAVDGLRDRGIRVYMITGDSSETARSVAEELGIDDWFAEVMPDAKSDRIGELRSEGSRVAMVGDGVNDAPALAVADLGIAIGAGTDVAAETADVILVENDPAGVLDVLILSEKTGRKMKQNLAWATGYNVIAIPLAAGVLYSWGVVLPPAVGALVMSLSTVIVAVNARLVSFDGGKSEIS